MALKENSIYEINGVTVKEYLIPDGYRWKSASKAQSAGFSANGLYKANLLLSGGTGKVKGVTIHNTSDLDSVNDDAEQYTRATYPNENMKSSRIHFYIDDLGAWQNLRAGTGMIEADPRGRAEVGWHAGDGTYGEGNNTTLCIECIMNGTSGTENEKAEDNTARIAAWLLWCNGLGIEKLYTHTYWINKQCGYTGDVDYQNTKKTGYNAKYNRGSKYCPSYILPHWKDFKKKVSDYLRVLNGEVVEYTKQEEIIKVEVGGLGYDDIIIGDIVEFDGGNHYRSSNASTSSAYVQKSLAKVMGKYKGKHPISLRAVNESGYYISGVYGWVDIGTIKSKVNKKEEVKSSVEEKEFNISTKNIVRIKSGAVKYYNGSSDIPNWVRGYDFKVRQTSVAGKVVKKGGNIVVLLGGKVDRDTGAVGSSINSWINIDNLEIVK